MQTLHVNMLGYSLGYAGGRFVGFLEIQIHVSWPSYRNNTFIPHLLVDVVVVSHCHSSQQQEEKMKKT